MSKEKNKNKENEKINFSLLQNNYNSSNNQTTGNVLVVNNALSNELYNNLEKEYISLKKLFIVNQSIKNNNESRNILLSNFNYMINSETALTLSDDIITPLWKDFIKYHTSRYFINEIQKQNQLNQHITVNLTLNYMSPILYQSTTKINQMNSNFAFLGFFFMKNSNDNSKVNNLEIFENEKRIISIPYQKNTFILIKNKNKNENGNNITFGFTEKNYTISSMKYIKFILL